MRKQLSALAYRLAMTGLCAYGLYINLFAGGAGFMAAGALRYYTLQSNILVLLVSLLSLGHTVKALVTGRDGVSNAYRDLRFVTATAILLTFGVFWGMLNGVAGRAYLLSPANLTVHAITPVLFMLDFLLLDRQKRLFYTRAPLAFIAPYAYFAYSLLYAKFQRNAVPKYPYWFMDLDTYGWFGTRAGLGVAFWVIALTIAMALCALVFIAIYNRGLEKNRS